MFKRTQQQLVLLNSMVLFIILASFGTFLYFYMQHRLDRQVDETLNHIQTHIAREHTREYSKLVHPDEDNDDNRIVYLIWGHGGTLQGEFPQDYISGETKKYLSKERAASPKNVRINGMDYRIIDVAIHRFLLIGGSREYVKRIQLVYNLKREREMLEHLRVFIELGSLISIAVSLLAGYFLANKALVPINRAWNKQTQFVTDASHELRTPLAVMKLNLERLFRHPKSSIEEESQNISQAISEINYMAKMVSDLLALARSDSNQLEMAFSNVNLSDLLHKAASDFSEFAFLKDIHFTSTIEEYVNVQGNEERLYQLIMIILDNSLKYTSAGGEIALFSNVKGGAVYISIIDSGAGIPKEDLPFIFDRFFRGDKTRTRKFEGTGLGLSIAKWIVELHRGRIRAESEAGAGTRIFIQLPSMKRHP
ncbi:sensor histidine kinase [Peribacillus kribbensis]|uniref:sensor histidine kinase n=1 Tax=Peribacillus kribbensis TaxID=356658 RepID=UPI000411F4F7|nr:HAMP domain-containing sensor histidine kinase [Peribacillus kribbensis]